ncbi:MAG: TlpA disulfide reductase family protein [Balneolales bacterium]
MKTQPFPLLFGFLIAMVQISCAQSSDNSEETPEAAEASDEKVEFIEKASFTDLEGNEVSISDFEGKTVLIDIWETWCAPCIISMPTLHKLAEDYPDDFAVIALSPRIMDSPEQVEEFVAENDYNFTYVYGRQLALDLEVQNIPYKIYVGPDGKYLTSVLGSQGPEEDYEKTKEIIEENRN